jgi:Domain of unknown function (DUF4124)
MSTSATVQVVVRAGISLALGLAALQGAAADTIYRSVDASGRVTYSSTPPANAASVQELAPPPEPSPADIQEALQRQQALQQAAARYQEELAAETARQEARLRAAEQALDAARAQRDQAALQTAQDWQGRQGGGHYLKGSYFQRLQAAEAAVQAAQKALAAARRDQQ